MSTSLSESHPSIHEHNRGTCPVSGQKHGFCPPQKDDSRSPCPALNAMANHGYISRDGKNLSAHDVMKGLMACYGLSRPLAIFLAYVGFILVKKMGRRSSLYDIGIHNYIEHDASLVHHDTPEGEKYAPIEIDQTLVEALIKDVQPGAEEVEAQSEVEGVRLLMSVEDVARSRVRREKECRPINSIRRKIAGGERAIILGVWESQGKGKAGIPLDFIKTWIGHERLPEGWAPDHVETFRAVVKRMNNLKCMADNIRLLEAQTTTTAQATAESNKKAD